MAMMTKEEHERHQRRRSRQLVGFLLCILILIGAVTVLRTSAALVGRLFDDSKRKEDFRQRLQCYVMLDPLPFDSLDQADPNQIREYAVWDVVNRALASPSGLNNYEKDADTDGIILPALEIDAAVTRLFGAGYTVEHATFESSDMNFLYMEEKQGWLVPVTGYVGQYTPVVEKLHRSQGSTYVTVGYIPTFSNGSFTFNGTTEPSKYMDYVFTKTNRVWYLTALQESEMKPAETAQTDVNDQNNADLDYDLDYDPAGALQNTIEAENEGLPTENVEENKDEDGDEEDEEDEEHRD